jgi:hypothetical protein
MTTFAGLLLALTVLSCILLTATLQSVAGKQAPGDAAMGQAITWIYCWILTILTWGCLSGLLIATGSRDLLPAWVGVAATLLVPASGIAAFAAMYLLDKTPARWPLAIPLGIPLLVCLYVIGLHQTSWRPTVAGWAVSGAVWAVVAALCVAVAPALSYQLGAADRREAARQADLADPVQRARRRKEGLAKLKAMPPEAPLEDWLDLLQPENEVRADALEILRKSDHRQSDMERLVESRSNAFYLGLAPELDLIASEPLCRALKDHLWNIAFTARLNGERGHSYEPDRSLQWLPWFTTHGCDCTQSIEHMEETVRQYYSDSPERQKGLAQLAALK